MDLCPEVFDWDDEGSSRVIVNEVPEDLEEYVREAVDTCSSGAIREV
ncbi:ferredoxin [Thermanaeromonas toyohensis]|nr:ferredoxin [Thermanaeromonas toyohensis]